MPIRVLKKHGIVEREGDLVRLNVNPLTLKQKAEVRRICEDRLQRFIAERRLSFSRYPVQAPLWLRLVCRSPR